jgi:hypothetical protein
VTLVNTETGELIEPMDADAARRLTERIRIAAANYTDAKAKVLRLVDRAKAGSAHLALGYKSWTAYLSDVLSDEPLRLAREDRRELVTRLADEGMSTRAIAPIVGASKSTVADDLAEPTVQNRTVDEPPAPVVRTTTGLDGRERTSVTAGRSLRPQPRPAAEKTLNLVALYATKAARAASDLTADQIRRTRPEADQWTADLRNSIEVLQHLVDSLDPEENK